MNRLQTEFFELTSEVGNEKYYDMLNILPPQEIAYNGFLVGEPWDYNSRDGSARYELYFKHEGKYYYGGLATVEEFNSFLVQDTQLESQV